MVWASRRLSDATLLWRTCSESPRREATRLPNGWMIDSSLLIESLLGMRRERWAWGPRGSVNRLPRRLPPRTQAVSSCRRLLHVDPGADVSPGLAVSCPLAL